MAVLYIRDHEGVGHPKKLNNTHSDALAVSCQNAITHTKSYKIRLRIRFSGVNCLLLIKSALIKLSIGQVA